MSSTRRKPAKPASQFAAYLRELREAAGVPLRTAAAHIGMSFPQLGRIERGEVSRPPSLHVITRIAAFYGRPAKEVMERAGVRLNHITPDEIPRGEEQFARLMLAPEYGKHFMKVEYLPHFPSLHRTLIMRLVSEVERHTRAMTLAEVGGDVGEGSIPPVSMRTFAEIVGAGTTKVEIDPSWINEE